MFFAAAGPTLSIRATYAFGSKNRGGTIMAWRKGDNYRSKILWHREHVMPVLDALAQKEA
jgi:hypothetical protein